MTDPKPDLSTIRDGSVLTKDLLVAAESLLNDFSCAEAGPLEAVLRCALEKARELDAMIDALCEAEGL